MAASTASAARDLGFAPGVLTRGHGGAARLPLLKILTLYGHPPMLAPPPSEIASLELSCAIRGIKVLSA